MLKKILIIFALAVAAFLIAAAMQPADFRVTRSATLSAQPAAVFEHVNDLHKWNDWSPWAKLDPAAKNTFEGPASGVGAVFRWAGNHEVGEGSMTITESRPLELIRIKLEFVKPFAATNTTEFVFKPAGDQTEVTWSMSGTNNFTGKCMSLVMNCDKMVGGMFEKGLANMAAVVEAKPKP